MFSPVYEDIFFNHRCRVSLVYHHFLSTPTSSFLSIGVFDNCSHSMSDKGWSVGIRTVESSSTKDARFYFSLRTDRAAKATTVYSHQRYQANTWTHLMATYNGLHMTLYVDGAKVCVCFQFNIGTLNSNNSCWTFILQWFNEWTVFFLFCQNSVFDLF